ncbi:uncharacterized protein BT62DRAFT_928471 [Guyanagaster necrorhizus]|uniref:Uncharacterized protein n=1 Tax=Guyanagaster necrorhizus TaxID=856835 RepID=A0A9P7W025_9AGAR|nr:uncharacterized protein BT62DRAFT_928471 [Guyanagaster necrorhizus MCA 3950]KAG7449738.1 hypothetical protein BT62DRAFT_928471 [Guyanagaster necrorhizus MCA 3950]
MSEPFSKHITYTPSGGDALVKSYKSTIYEDKGDQAFYAAIDTYLVDATWIPKMSWENNTSAAQSYALTYTTELKVTKGSEVTTSIKIAGAFRGLSISMGTSVKEFNTYETTNTTTKTITLNVPAKSTLTFYQRRYRFRDTMFFILDAWNEMWKAGSWGSFKLTKKACVVEIMSEDYLTADAKLDDSTTGTMVVKKVPRATLESSYSARKRENLTDRAKEVLDDIDA